MSSADGFSFTHWHFPPATHQPVLYEVANRCRGTILEFGCGEGSTRLLSAVSRRRGLKLITLETDPDWMARYASLASPLHEFRLVTDWGEVLASDEWDDGRWGLVFVDQHPSEARVATIHRFRSNAEWIVLHDCDYLPVNGLLGRTVRPLLGPRDVGERAYDDVFSSWKEFFPLEPWPLPTTGPPTLLASNLHSCNIDVDYARYNPSAARRAVHRIAQRIPAPLRL